MSVTRLLRMRKALPLVVVYLLGCLTVKFVTFFDENRCLDTELEKSSSKEQQPEKNFFMLVMILSAPRNVNQRNAIRETWVTAKETLANRNFHGESIYIPRFDFDGFLQSEPVERQKMSLDMFMDWSENLKIPRFEDLNVKVKHLFPVGVLGMDEVDKRVLKEENDEFGDILFLDDLQENYVNLTRKILTGFEKVVREYKFEYLLKVDDDTFVNLQIIAEDLLSYHKAIGQSFRVSTTSPSLYWGYFNGRAQIKTGGQWKESHFNIADRFLPYALGGGYVLSKQLVNYIAVNRHILSPFRSEDVSVGTWLAPLRNVYRRHDVRFDTGYIPRKCKPYHIVMHKRSAEDMFKLWNGISCSQLQTSVQYQNKLREYFYDWTAPPSKCCDTLLN